jgi:hypothetical protein
MQNAECAAAARRMTEKQTTGTLRPDERCMHNLEDTGLFAAKNTRVYTPTKAVSL